MAGPSWSELVLFDVPFEELLVLLTQHINFQNAENSQEIKRPSSNPMDCCLSWKISHSHHHDKEQDQMDFSLLHLWDEGHSWEEAAWEAPREHSKQMKLEPIGFCLSTVMTVSSHISAFTLSKPQDRTMPKGKWRVLTVRNRLTRRLFKSNG